MSATGHCRREESGFGLVKLLIALVIVGVVVGVALALLQTEPRKGTPKVSKQVSLKDVGYHVNEWGTAVTLPKEVPTEDISTNYQPAAGNQTEAFHIYSARLLSVQQQCSVRSEVPGQAPVYTVKRDKTNELWQSVKGASEKDARKVGEWYYLVTKVEGLKSCVAKDSSLQIYDSPVSLKYVRDHIRAIKP